GNVVHLGVTGFCGQAAGNVLDDLVTRVGNGVDRVAEANNHFLVFDATTDVLFGLIRRFVALLHFKCHFVGTTVLGSSQRADPAGNCGIHVGTRSGDYAAGEGGGVELVLCVKNQGSVHCTDPGFLGLFTVQQTQKVSADGVVVGLNVDHAAIVAEVIPIEQGRAQACHQTVGNIACVGNVVIVFLRQQTTQN